MKINPIKYDAGKLFVLDQLLLPIEVKWITVENSVQAFDVIKNMNVRGAPLIGFTGVFGLMFSCNEASNYNDLREKANYLISSRPTAVNLSFEINSCFENLQAKYPEYNANSAMEYCLDFVNNKIEKLERDNVSTANFLKNKLEELYPGRKSYNILTICNTGRLACGTTGTALGAISVLNDHDMINNVFACETRPYLQGARLTAYELVQENIKHYLIPDGAVSHVLKTQKIDAIFVGADRIAVNGDTANKIGTSSISIIAKYYQVPFFVVAPLSSFDFNCVDGDQIEIELRQGIELTTIDGKYISPRESEGFNPAFDVTDSINITGIACERGIFSPSQVKDLLN